MNKFMKFCLIGGGICVIAGGIVMIAAAAMGARMGSGILFRNSGLSHSIVNEVLGDIRSDIEGEFYNAREDFYDYDYDYSYNWNDQDDSWADYGSMEHGSIVNNMESEKYSKYLDKTGKYQYTYSTSVVKSLDVTVREGRAIYVADDSLDQIMISSNVSESLWKAEMDGSTLKIEINNDGWYDRGQNDPVYIRVPGAFRFGKADITVKDISHVGRTSHESPEFYGKGMKAEELDVTVKAASAIFDNADAGKLDMESDVGFAGYTGGVTGDVDINCKVGAIGCKLNGSETDFNFDISCKLGAVSVGNQNYAGLSGKREIDNQASKKMELDCNTGAVEVQFQPIA